MTPIRKWCEKRNIGTTLAYRLLKEGKLKAVKLNSKTYITDEEDDRFIKSLPTYAPQGVGA